MSDLQKDISDVQLVNDKLVTDNNKVARFAYTDTAYTDDLVDGVAEYNFNNDQNIPLTTAGNLQVSDQFLDKGVRAQASSIPRMFLNGMLGRMSYNLNKAQDFLKTVLGVTQRSLTRDFCLYSPTARYQYLDGCYMSNPLNPTDVSLFTRINSGQAYLVGTPPYKEDGTIDSVNWKETGDPRVPIGIYKKIPQLFSGTFSGLHPVNPDTNTADTRWQLCDGTNGTPDLRNKFIRGGTGSNQGDTGGADTKSFTVLMNASSFTVSGNTNSVSGLQSHRHLEGVRFIQTFNWYTYGYKDTASSALRTSEIMDMTTAYRQAYTETVGSGSTHAHTFSDSVTITPTSRETTVDVLPSYYTLAYIMYVG